jgi:very-short-patch-repair endonuclease
MEWGLPRPECNVAVLGYEVDFVWSEQRVIVELDAFATHGSAFAFERDRARDRALQAAGWSVIRVTARQLDEALAAVRADVERVLSRQLLSSSRAASTACFV